ncbi:unnamed protein product [Arctia plantaginis]|uniref:Uncharacterized protein n=1 Tax=Arctia plantaginis TaxID=874455 RepID=A0A8S1BEN6_ARCPL|nr:unnamed protein product [Arctia plantaginis]
MSADQGQLSNVANFKNVTTKETLKSKDINDVFTLQADHNEMKIICEGKSNSETSNFFVNLHRVDNNVEDVLFNITPVVYSDYSNTFKTYVVLENMTFNITLFNYNASEARCCHYYNGFYNFPIKLENAVEENKFISIIMVPSASEDMSTVWKCTLIKMDSPDQYVIFDMRVKGKNNLNITIGGLEQKPAVLDFSEVECDAISHYWYEAGEAIDLDCVNLHAGGTIQLKYYDKNFPKSSLGLGTVRTKLIETDLLWQVPINFRKSMHSSNDGDMITCTYKTEYYDYKYTHRIVFKLKTESSSKGVIKIDVNNFRLVPITVSEANRSIYQYKYYEGDTLMVTCGKDKTASGFLQFETNEIEFMERNKCCRAELQEQNLWLKKNTIKLNTEHLNGKHLTCNLTDDRMISTADIMFLVETKQLYVIGLSMSDMIYHYKKNMSTWILDYKYSEDQVLHLTCVATTESNLRWIYSNSSEEFYNKTKSISHKFTLKPEVNKTTITCEATDIETMYIQSVCKPTSYTAVDTTNSNVVVIISFSVATLVSVFGITMAFCTCIKRKDTSDSQNETSRNQHQLRPLPEVPSVPRQRQPLYSYDYVYSSSDYEDLQPVETSNNSNQQNTLYYWADCAL